MGRRSQPNGEDHQRYGSYHHGNLLVHSGVHSGAARAARAKYLTPL
jgi:hypothetical protein